MVDLLRVTVKGDIQVKRTLNRIRKKLPEMTSQAMMQWGKILERDMKSAARQAGIRNFTGRLLKRGGIEWRQRPKGRIGRLFIAIHGVMLDSMKPHFVNITRNRTRFLRWGLQAGSSNIRRGARGVAARTSKTKSVFVRPHPFIRTGWRRARPKLNNILAQQTRRAIKSA